jgi:hypothetical protein
MTISNETGSKSAIPDVGGMLGGTKKETVKKAFKIIIYALSN